MGVRPTKLENAKTLADKHKNNDPFVRRVFLLKPSRKERQADPIVLLEVVEGTVERGIDPVYFQPDPARNLHYPLAIIDVSPSEFAGIGTPIVVRGQKLVIDQELGNGSKSRAC